jgi:hypothetical protein
MKPLLRNPEAHIEKSQSPPSPTNLMHMKNKTHQTFTELTYTKCEKTLNELHVRKTHQKYSSEEEEEKRGKKARPEIQFERQLQHERRNAVPENRNKRNLRSIRKRSSQEIKK